MAQGVAASATAVPGARASTKLMPVTMALFFAFGFCTVLIDTLTPKLKAMFSLNYTEVALTPFVFFGAYFVMSAPAAWLLTRLGYLQSITVGLVVTAAGCLLFTPAASSGVYEMFLLATFVMAGGITIVQVAVNPLTAMIGDPRHSHSRLTLGQAFNSLATTVGPLFGAALILAHSRETPNPKTISPALLAVFRRQEAHAVQGPFFGIAVAVLLLAGACVLFYRLSPKVNRQAGGGYARVLKSPRLLFGVVSIFVYVGAEVAIGSFLTNYLLQPGVSGGAIGRYAASHSKTTLEVAGSLVSLYWGGAMVGRFAGAAVLRRVRAGTVLTVAALGAGVLVCVSCLGAGMVAAVAILAVGLFNSIMFPTIFTLAIEDLGEDAPAGSGLLCLAIFGGAVVPFLVGKVADGSNLSLAFLVPVACYVVIAAYGWAARVGWVDRRASQETVAEVLG